MKIVIRIKPFAFGKVGKELYTADFFGGLTSFQNAGYDHCRRTDNQTRLRSKVALSLFHFITIQIPETKQATAIQI